MKFTLTATPQPDDIEAIKNGLRAYNTPFLGEAKMQELAVMLTDNRGNRLAGLSGSTLGHWLRIDFLWVDPTLRGQDIGTQLIQQAEEEARRRGCRFAQVDTFSFQARPFYERNGYQCRMALEEYLTDVESPDAAYHQRFYLSKAL